jgi:hypothetical protein
VERAQLGTVATSHEDEAAVQRGAYHFKQRIYEVARDILENHSSIDNSFIDETSWDFEGRNFLTTLSCTTFVGVPVPAEEILGELSRDGMFTIWWDERRQKIPLLAVRPPQEIPVKWNDVDNIASFSKRTVMDDRMTRVTVYFTPRDVLQGLEDPTNYRNRRIRIDLEVESEVAAGGSIVDNTIFSRWVRAFSNALLLSASLLLRYRLPPEFVTIEIDAKDRSINIGDVVDLTTRYVRDTEGGIPETRWQVIALEEPEPGSKMLAELQSYQFVGKFAIIMANDTADYAEISDADRLRGCWLSDDDGLMPDGTDGYLLQ